MANDDDERRIKLEQMQLNVDKTKEEIEKITKDDNKNAPPVINIIDAWSNENELGHSNIQKEVNPHFKPVWTTNKPYNILRGGRNSFKSSIIPLMLVYMMLRMLRKGEKSNVVVIRKVSIGGSK